MSAVPALLIALLFGAPGLKMDAASFHLQLFIVVCMVGFASIWLSFFPPAAYVARLRGSAAK
jgi:hypothetical protein